MSTTMAGLGTRSPALLAYRAISEDLVSGRWEAGTRLPSERALSEQLGVSRTTVRTALQELADSGLIEPSPRRGWVVAEHRLSEGSNSLRSFSEAALDRGLSPGAVVLRQRVRAASLDEAEALGLAPAADIVDLERLRTLDGVAIAIQSLRIPHRLVPGLEHCDLSDVSLHAVLAQRFGVHVGRCDFTLQADGADERVAGILRLVPGAPVLIGHEVTFDTEERAVCTGSTTYRGDAYRFTASMFRA